MTYSVSFFGKQVKVELTRTALRTLLIIDNPLQVEMELYFSCLIRKRVLFRDAVHKPMGEPVVDDLYVQFRPVMTRHCGIDFDGDEPPLTDFPIDDAAPFVPKWLSIDYRKGKWRGEFGY